MSDKTPKQTPKQPDSKSYQDKHTNLNWSNKTPNPSSKTTGTTGTRDKK